MLATLTWELSAIIDKERRDMVANKILIATFAIDLGCKTMSVTFAFASAHTCDDDGEAGEDLADGTLLKPACLG